MIAGACFLRSGSGASYLCAAWAFLSAIVTESFFGNLNHWYGQNYGPLPQKLYTVMVGVFPVYTLSMTFWCLRMSEASRTAVE